MMQIAAWAAACVLGAAASCDGDEQEATTSGEAECGALLIASPCFDCAEAACCSQISACFGDAESGGCADCAAGDDAACAASEVWKELYACGDSSCNSECRDPAVAACDAPEDSPSMGACAPDGGCNPVTGEGCAAGETCDFDGKAFTCYSGSDATRTLCEDCGNEVGFCTAGSMCFASYRFEPDAVVLTRQCARYCCDDADCGTGRCSFVLKTGDGQAVSVGACVTDDPAAGGAATAGSGGGAGGAESGGGGGGGSGG
jgi:hypothetical protein